MAKGERITAAQWLQLFRLMERMPSTQACRTLGISERSGERLRGYKSPDEYPAELRKAWEVYEGEKRDREQRGLLMEGRPGLSPVALAALNDIELFARRYFGIILRPWQKLAADKIVELYASPDEEYVVINVAPGSGKTTFFCKILPAWITARDRSVRGLQGSNVQRLADMNVRQLRREMERSVPIRAEPKEMQMGLAVDAEACLADDYGSFKPENPELWRGDTFVVAQPGDLVLSDKEPTWTSFGRNTGFLGFRYDFIIWDDVYDSTAMRTAEAREDMRKWLDDIAETRLEPGGLLILQGQRLSAEDIYRYALDKVRYIDEDGDGEEDAAPAGPKYHHIKFQAHDDEGCQGLHRRDSPAWPEGCLLDPRRLPYSKIRTLRENDSKRYAVVYQQEDVAADSTLVNPLWITGGTGQDGVEYPGCWDNDRDLWEIPRGVAEGRLLVVASADPSPTKFWAIQCWAVNLDTGFRYLLECYRQQMDAPSFLDFNEDTRTFTGIAEEWWQITSKLGHPITHWIVEANAAQKFIMQYDFFRRWSSTRGVNLVPHYTHSRNKTDPDYGVWMIAKEYKHGRVRLPGKSKTYARPHSLLLANEVTHWTPEREHLQTDDCVMAHWFMEHNLGNIKPPDSNPVHQWRPTWMRQRRHSGAKAR